MSEPPASISRYQIVELLASGDAGAVYKAFDPMIERMVAVKVLSAGLEGVTIDAGVKEAFYREMQKAGTLNHPAIAILFDVGEAQQGLFSAAEFVDGTSLAKGVPPELDVRARITLIGQVADALEYAQEMGVPHLNLKPSSVLVRSDLTLKVTGFGIARILTALGRVTGSRELWVSPYVAPERLEGADGDARSDVFGLAMLTGQLLTETSMADVSAASSPAEPRKLSQVCPPGFAALGFTDETWMETFGRALAPDPDKRFSTATSFLAAVMRVLGVTRPMTPRVWNESSRVVLSDGFADQSRWSETALTDGGSPGAGAHDHAGTGDDEPVTWAHSSVSPAHPVPAADVGASTDPDTTALAARVELQAMTPTPPEVAPIMVQPPAPVIPSPLPKPATSRGFPKAAAALIGVLAGAVAVGLLWFFVPGVRGLLKSLSPQQASTSPAADATGGDTPSTAAPSSEPTMPAATVDEVPAEPAQSVTPAAAGSTLGLLRITTTPPGAQVTIDGKPRGVTPLRLGNLSLSAHVVEIALEGYAPETPAVVLTATRATQTLNMTLRPLPTEPVTAQLSIETAPAGANIFLDDEAAGLSPVTLPRISAGRHVIRAEHDGFDSATREVDVRAGESSNVTVQLTPRAAVVTAGPIEFDRVEVKPRQTSGPASPGYPSAARSRRLTGFVVASWIVDERGVVNGITMLEVSSPVFENEVRDWLETVRFLPGQQAGQPVKVILKRRFTFALGREEE